jgi:ubiquinone/menaquinone biosynthesis C-methylase UbiE
MDHATFEENLERNPLRMWVRERYEVRPLRDAVPPTRIDRALHYCCRNGTGTALLHKYFSPGRMEAVDPDEALVNQARERVAGLPVDCSVGSLTRLTFADASFDAVFVLGELHNYPDWRDCVAEISRVTKPGGLFLLEELSAESFENGLGRYFRDRTKHDYGSMLRLGEFVDLVRASGFEVLRLRKPVPFGLFKYFVLAARRNEAPQ